MQPKLTPDDVGKKAKFVVPVRGAHKVAFRVDVKIMEVENIFGRQDVKIEPVAGDGHAWVSGAKLEEIKP